MVTRKDPGGGKKPPSKPVASVKKPVAKKTVARVTAKKTAVKPKAKPGKDYMKPVGGTKQEGYKAPGSFLDRKGKGNYGYSAGEGAGQKYSGLSDLKSLGYRSTVSSSKLLKTGINPTAMKATSGNPKPTNAQMAAGKKASASAKTRAAAKAKAKAAADKAAKAKDAKTAKKPTTGVYKRGNP